MIESRKTEIRYTTTDPKRMINKYLVNRLCRKWTETFIDEDTGETVPIERTELILASGTFITPEHLSTIQFYMCQQHQLFFAPQYFSCLYYQN